MSTNQPFPSDGAVLEGGGLVLKIAKAEDLWGCELENGGPCRLYVLGAQFLLEGLLQNCETDGERARVQPVLEALKAHLSGFDAVTLN